MKCTSRYSGDCKREEGVIALTAQFGNADPHEHSNMCLECVAGVLWALYCTKYDSRGYGSGSIELGNMTGDLDMDEIQDGVREIIESDYAYGNTDMDDVMNCVDWS